MEFETPHQSGKNLKRGSEDVIDLEGEKYGGSKRMKLFEEGNSSPVWGFQLLLGEVICRPCSHIPEEIVQNSLPMIMQLYSKFEEINRNVKESMESQLEAQFISYYQNRFLYSMDLERNKLKLSFSLSSSLTVSSSSSFKIVNLIVDSKQIPIPDRINLHRQTGDLIYNYLHKTSSFASKVEALLEKVVNQLKLEKSNSIALTTQNEELKKLVVKVGLNPKYRSDVHKLL